MSFPIIPDPVPLRLDDCGVIRVGKTRVSLDSVIYSHRRGLTPAEIQDSFPTLELKDVFATVAYYLSHQAEVDAYIAAQEREGERIRQEAIAAGFSPRDPKALYETLRQRWDAMQGKTP
jgi:uncharacterized protein (DUF433 family)